MFIPCFFLFILRADGSVKNLHEFIVLVKLMLLTLLLSELAECGVFSTGCFSVFLGIVFFSSSVEENKKKIMC